jgi:DNA-binding response OmpR family regulator
MKVMVVDDDSAVRDSLSRVLKDTGYEVVLARDGQEALERFDPRQIDLLLLDLGLPITDGWDAFEQITDLSPALPIIIITGQAHQYDHAAAAGVGALMEKPLDAEMLLQTMRDLLSETKEERFKRLCGLEPGLRHVPSASAEMLRELRANHKPVGYRPLLTATRRCDKKR